MRASFKGDTDALSDLPALAAAMVTIKEHANHSYQGVYALWAISWHLSGDNQVRTCMLRTMPYYGANHIEAIVTLLPAHRTLQL